MENKTHGYVYLITNLINGKQYVGQTIRTLKIRFSKHLTDSKHGKFYINRAIKKYGIENFKIEEIAVAYNQEQLNFSEGFYMRLFKTLAPNGYNLKEIIDGKGRHSEKTKEKMKIARNKPERLKTSSEIGKRSRGKVRKNSKSKYCGVSLRKNTYIAGIKYNNKRIYLGSYHSEIDAAKAYDLKALELFGYDCILNFPKLREDYINNKIIINKKLCHNHLKPEYKGVWRHENCYRVKYFDNILGKYRMKYLKTLQEAIKFKNIINQ